MLCYWNVSTCYWTGAWFLREAKILIDDTFVCGDSEEEHDKNLFAVLNRLQETVLTVSDDKCVFKKKELEFFGIKFIQDGV